MKLFTELRLVWHRYVLGHKMQRAAEGEFEVWHDEDCFRTFRIHREAS
jgi:hypothetical protein